MSSLTRARIVPGPSTTTSLSTTFPERPPRLLAPDRHRRIADHQLRAQETAREILARAQAEASALVDAAKRAAETIAREAAEEASQAEQAKVAALFLRIRQEDEQRAERDVDRSITIAVVLAERLLGTALAHDPKLIVQMAHQALSEARGARRVVIEASPLDADVLQRHLVDVGFEPHHVEIRSDPSQGRGALRISTNLGTLDAQLRPQIERLAKALRDTLHRS
jgi:flagellar biosynthesis/type III secretory pathway protein FliH